MKRLSILIPVHNHFNYLVKCIDSVKRQKVDSIEIICVDDCSSDKRVIDYLMSLQDLGSITTTFHAQNLGIAQTLNHGVDLSCGEFIAFVDCDDYVDNRTVAEILDHLDRFPDIDYFFTDRYDIDENDKILRIARYGGYPNIKPSNDTKSDLLQGMVASHLKVIRKDTIVQVGGFNPRLTGVQDWDLALKIAELGNFFYIKRPLYFHRIHSMSVTQSDSVSQFRKTNIVRRHFITRWYQHLTEPDDTLQYVKGLVSLGEVPTHNNLIEKHISWFVPMGFKVETVMKVVKLGNFCVFDARKSFQLDWINFLREYNSFFDLIILDKAEIAASLIGYVWDINILWQT